MSITTTQIYPTRFDQWTILDRWKRLARSIMHWHHPGFGYSCKQGTFTFYICRFYGDGRVETIPFESGIAIEDVEDRMRHYLENGIPKEVYS